MIIYQFLESKFTQHNVKEMDVEELQRLQWEPWLLALQQEEWWEWAEEEVWWEEATTSQPTLRLASTSQVPNNLPTTETTLTQLPMLSAVDPNSPIPMQELANGGKLVSALITSSIESESWTEEIAAEEDSLPPRFSLVLNSVVQFKEELRTENGTKLNAQNQLEETRSD